MTSCSPSRNEDALKVFQPWKSGYVGNVAGWRQFLKCWQTETMAFLHSDGAQTPMDKEVLDRGSLMFEEATRSAIEDAEHRLGMSFPKSVKDFWMASGGWIQLRLDADDGKIYGPAEIDRIATLYPDLINADALPDSSDEDYFTYSESQDSIDVRESYIETAFAMSEMVDAGLYVLNPSVKTEDGEWEAWFLGWELPGALRFKSFAHLMQYAYLNSMHREEREHMYYSGSEIKGTCADAGLTNLTLD